MTACSTPDVHADWRLQPLTAGVRLVEFIRLTLRPTDPHKHCQAMGLLAKLKDLDFYKKLPQDLTGAMLAQELISGR